MDIIIIIKLAKMAIFGQMFFNGYTIVTVGVYDTDTNVCVVYWN